MKSSYSTVSIVFVALCLFLGSFVIPVQCKDLNSKNENTETTAEKIDNDRQTTTITDNVASVVTSSNTSIDTSVNTIPAPPKPAVAGTNDSHIKADNTTLPPKPDNTTTTTTTTTTTEKTTTSTTSTTPSTTTTSTTVSPNTTTTTTTTTTPAPPIIPCHRFDGSSFMGGIVLTLGSLAIGGIAYKFYKAHNERNYQTL